MSKDQVEVYISLGGNIGDPSITIEDALANLSNQNGVKVNTRSRFYRTPPWGNTDQAEFVNACASLSTTLSAEDLLKTCLDLETRMGRMRREKWGPRIIDIDMLTYGDQSIESETLTVPHPHMAERAFVLVPLKEIAPDFSLNGQSIDSMLETLDLTGIESLDHFIEQPVAS